MKIFASPLSGKTYFLERLTSKQDSDRIQCMNCFEGLTTHQGFFDTDWLEPRHFWLELGIKPETLRSRWREPILLMVWSFKRDITRWKNRFEDVPLFEQAFKQEGLHALNRALELNPNIKVLTNRHELGPFSIAFSREKDLMIEMWKSREKEKTGGEENVDVPEWLENWDNTRIESDNLIILKRGEFLSDFFSYIKSSFERSQRRLHDSNA